uniref:serine C-palmitoyltransferase n=1 Tax=Compsopogon caeruleus TaxID=31354 RepID=A0A7S1XAN4_9RHOD
MGESSTAEPLRTLNLGSYNYLGYAEVPGGIDGKVLGTLHRYGVATCGASAGVVDIQRELEQLVARYLGKEDAVVSGMGFATNAQLIPSIVGPGCLVVSDEMNHCSIVVGARSSGAKIKVFRHNNVESLETILRDAIVEGQPLTGDPWLKILIVVEGLYSMEGVTCRLRDIVAVKKKYNAYLYLDEAHSIGALGRTGRGAGEYWDVDLKDIDIMMGTFTKSFGAVGGYVSGSRGLIDRIRYTSAGALYGTAMSPVCAEHIVYALKQIMGEDGTKIGQEKIAQLHSNSIYFRRKLTEMGLQLYGDYDSPVIPIMLYLPSKIAAFSRECLKRGVAVVVVGFPATPLILSRARICLSAAHTREDLDLALDVIEEVADLLQLRYAFWKGEMDSPLSKGLPSCSSSVCSESSDGDDCE